MTGQPKVHERELTALQWWKGETFITNRRGRLRNGRYPGRLHDLQSEFGREYTQLSRVFHEVVDWLWDRHLLRITDNLDLYAPHFEEMARKIEIKGGVGLEKSCIVGFVDGTIISNCRPGRDQELQRELFDGQHRKHGLVWQSVVFPNGMIGDLHGPEVGRRHDAYAWPQSGVNAKLASVQAGNAVQCKVSGDAAYPIYTHIDRGFKGANLTDAQKAYN